MNNDSFNPQPWAKNPHLQTVFGSFRLRAGGPNPIRECSREVIVDGGNGARLLGYHSRRREGDSRGLVLLIHGWEGSADSTYILSTGRYLFLKGYDIFRLNLRDHGKSHHLNEGLFHGALTDEVFHAAGEISRLAPDRFFIVGFSLGGNFALRIALKATESTIAPLQDVISISPSLDPHKATVAIDESLFIYRHYFLKKWKRSLLKKQALYPHRYDFGYLMNLRSCMAVTEAIMKYYPDFPTYRDYFRQYTLTGDALAALGVPVTIIASEDDPIISVRDLQDAKANGCLRRLVQRHGGHCGFLEPFPFGCWYERKVHEILENSRRHPL